MSKVSKITARAMAASFQSRQEAVFHADMVLTGKRTISRDEAIKLFGDAADALDVQFTRMEANMQAIASAEMAVADRARDCISSSKNLAAQIGDAMARIDKVVVRDFDLKLDQLERFVAAIKTLVELNADGRMNDLAAAFIRTK